MEKYYALAEKILSDLVGINTVNDNELEAARYIENVLSPYGFKTEIVEIEKNRANICATIGNGDKTLILTGHLDTVPAGNGWQSNPFVLTKRGSRLYGRGTADMKGSVAAMCASAICAAEQGLTRDYTLKLVFVCGEEGSGMGSKYYASQNKPNGNELVVIGEPTLLRLCIAHRGVVRFRVKIVGRQCHSGMPYDGINAIYHAARFLLSVEKLDKAKQSLDCGILPPPNITATTLHSGVKENVVPGESEIIIDCRTVVGQTADGLKHELSGILAGLFDNTPVEYEIEQFIENGAAATESTGEVCTLLQKSYRSAFKREPTVTYFEGCCDMPYFKNNGYSETLLCGGGSMEQAHIVDEFIEQSELYGAVTLYTEIIKNF